MITVINTLSGKYFSCMIPDLVFSINGYRATVTILVDGKVIFQEYMYPLSSRISMSDIGELITPYAKASLIVNMNVIISEEYQESDVPSITSLSADVIYCVADIGTTADDFCTNHFLSVLLGRKETAIGRLEYLHYIGTDEAVATAIYNDGSKATFPVATVGGNDKYTTIDVTPSQFVVEGKTLVAFSVTAGGRVQEYVIDLENPDCAPVLIFDNSFGVEELIYCTGTHSVDPSYKRDTAWVHGKQRNYNIKETRTFKADTGIMNVAMANWADELFRSPYIRVVNFVKGAPDVGKEVMITESKSSYSNDNDTLIRFTFSYQYAQRNQNVVQLRREGRIFDNTFDHTFN